MSKYAEDILSGQRVKKWHLESDNHPTYPMDWAVCELCGHKVLGEPYVIHRRGSSPRSGDRYCIDCRKVIECSHKGIHIGTIKKNGAG